MLRPSLLSPVIPFTLFFFACGANVSAEAIGVNLKEELGSASVVTPAKIIAYDPVLLKFQPAGSTAVLSAKYSTDPAWNPSRYISKKWPPQDTRIDLTGEWPPPGAEVLVVVDKDNVISLFAWTYGDSYRFWSPTMAESIAFFNCTALGHPIKETQQEHPDSGWDGCWVQKSKIVEKGLP